MKRGRTKFQRASKPRSEKEDRQYIEKLTMDLERLVERIPRGDGTTTIVQGGDSKLLRKLLRPLQHAVAETQFWQEVRHEQSPTTRKGPLREDPDGA